ncbi:MAG TPA: cation:proton antiporter [Gemmatimonadales bacterium]|nr:cation:proton antiporter [Gemmatimonadales bacterium]
MLLLLDDASAAAQHADPVAAVVLFLAVILVAAKLGGDLAIRLGQPAVLGELTVGILIGNLPLLGVHLFEPIRHDASIDMLSRLGVILLLFEVGLESTVAQMLRVGWSSLLVACIGVIFPFVLGWGISAWLLPAESEYVHAFIGATLTATSVGITARVLQDLGKSQTGESRIILGAAVIDDVLGLLILAIVAGVISAADRGVEPSYGALGLILLKAILFLVGALFLGRIISPRLFNLACRLRARGVLLATGLAFCFLLAYLAAAVGLAPIVGAFSAGLILEDVHYKELQDQEQHSLEELVHPITSFLVPVFFVLMGMRTDLASFLQPGVLGLAAAITVVAVLGKQFAGLGVVTRGVDRITVGIGMIPRGEVGLIFANIGLTLTVAGEKIVTNSTFSAVVVMVVLTTLVTPPALRWRFGQLAKKPGNSP